MLTRFACGHVGLTTAGKVKVFIRVAEVRNARVTEETEKNCPDHGRI